MNARRGSSWDESATAHRDACRYGWRAKPAPRPNLAHPANPMPSDLRRIAACAADLADGQCTEWSDDCPVGPPARHFATARKYRSAFAPLRLLLDFALLLYASRLNVEQLGRGAEDVGLLIVTQRGASEDVIHRL